jgi:HAD superfamily hydrolase (TIGR01509 family)
MVEESIKHYIEKHGFEAFCPKAVLFDMDGVLYNSMPNHAIAWQKSMAKFGIHMTADDAYATEGMRGIDTIRMMVREQQGKDITEAEAQQMYDEKTHVFHSLPETQIMPGMLELMKIIHQSGLGIGVVTGSGQRPLINRLLHDFGEYLDMAHIVTAYDVKYGKPKPDPYLMGLNKAGNLQPWEAIVVENAPLGVRAAQAARIFTIGANTGPLPDSELINEHADIVVESIAAILPLAKQLFNQG